MTGCKYERRFIYYLKVKKRLCLNFVAIIVGFMDNICYFRSSYAQNN